jgi:hypothetical protein
VVWLARRPSRKLARTSEFVGQVPENWRPGTGTMITGEAADKANAAALGKYPGGTVNRVLKLGDGSYAVHLIKIRWPHHVFVSNNFEVTGAIGYGRCGGDVMISNTPPVGGRLLSVHLWLPIWQLQYVKLLFGHEQTCDPCFPAFLRFDRQCPER